MQMKRAVGLFGVLAITALSAQGCAAAMGGSENNPGVRECGQYMLAGGITGLAIGAQASSRREAAAAGAALGATAGYAICRRVWQTRQEMERKFAALEAELEAERVAHAEAAAAAAATGEAASEQPAEASDRLVRSVDVIANRATRLNLNSALMFDVGQSDLRPIATGHLRVLAESLRETTDNHACVIGHTDSTGSLDLNMRLSLERAREVASFLNRNGVPASRVHIEGRGPREPVATNATPEGRQENRRVEILLVPDQVDRREVSGNACPFVLQ